MPVLLLTGWDRTTPERSTVRKNKSHPATLYEERVVANKLEINTGGCSGVLHMKTAVEHAHRGSLNDRIKMQQQSHWTRKLVAGHTWSARKLCEFSEPPSTKSYTPSSSATWAENWKSLSSKTFSSNHQDESTIEQTCHPDTDWRQVS